jgi:hypothetical protein
VPEERAEKQDEGKLRGRAKPRGSRDADARFNDEGKAASSRLPPSPSGTLSLAVARYGILTVDTPGLPSP